MSTELDLSHPELAPAPTTLFANPKPSAIVAQAVLIAREIAPLIKDRNLYKRIGASDHVYLEGWTLAGTMLGVFAVTVDSGPIFDHDGNVTGYQATVEARTMAGAVVGRADAECTRDEPKWTDKDSFQLRSMAQTRASSKALRMPLGFVVKLAGYETTPAEEMEAAAARGETVSGGRGVRPGWRDIAEQQRAHAEVGTLIDNLGARQWVAEWLESKGYERPLAKVQLRQLRAAIEREFEQRGQESPPSPNDPEVPSEADRSRAEGAHVDGSQPGAGEDPPPPDATPPPARPPVPPRSRAGGTKGDAP
jgi:hypothetical protein